MWKCESSISLPYAMIATLPISCFHQVVSFVLPWPLGCQVR